MSDVGHPVINDPSIRDSQFVDDINPKIKAAEKAKANAEEAKANAEEAEADAVAAEAKAVAARTKADNAKANAKQAVDEALRYEFELWMHERAAMWFDHCKRTRLV